MKLCVLRFWWGLVGSAMLTGTAIAEIPTGIFVKIEEEERNHSTRLELTGGPEAFLLLYDRIYHGTAEFASEKLQLKFKGADDATDDLIMTLSPSDQGWLDKAGHQWLPRKQVLKIDPSWTATEIQVRDQAGKGLGKFGYTYHIEWKGGNWGPLLVRPIEIEGETLEIFAPLESTISFEIEHPDLVRGYKAGAEISRKNGAKKLNAVVERGLTITGKAVNDLTGEPVANAVVCPHIFTQPLYNRDLERAVITGEDGLFTLRGVDGSFSARHPDFLQAEIWIFEKKDAGKPQVLRMKAGETIQGVVQDPEGTALAGVTVSDGSGKRAVTDAKGTFVLRGLRKWSSDQWSFDFSKEGYDKFSFRAEEIAPEGLKIELVPLPEFRGQIVLADGSPAQNFLVVCGPGTTPDDFKCVQLAIINKTGRFQLQPGRLPEKGNEFWFGIRAEGAAPWDGIIPMAQLSSGDFRVELTAGVTLTANLDLPLTAKGPIKVNLEAADRLPEESFIAVKHPGKALASYELKLKQGETLRVPHLRAGEYTLKIRCDGASPVERAVIVGDTNLDLGKLQLQGTGSISGFANEPYGSGAPWRFADGEIHVEGFGDDIFDSYLQFKTDAEGKFQVDGVPVGELSVVFPYFFSADIVDAVNRRVRVLEGKNTEVRFEGLAGSWNQELHLVFGSQAKLPQLKYARAVDNVTDRDPMFRFEVSPFGKGPTSWPDSIESFTSEGITSSIPDLTPGRWRIRVYDWLGSRGFDEGLRSEVIAEVTEKHDPITIKLGAHTLNGRVTSERETRRHTRIVAVGTTSGRVFLSRCDGEGDFVVRYLPADRYFLHAHDDEGGWCDLGIHKLDQALVNCGEHQLTEGGQVTGMLNKSLLNPNTEDGLRAVSEDGIEIPVDEIEDDGRFSFGNLRPGKWTIVMTDRDREIARRPVQIRKGQTVKVPVINEGG